MISITFTFIGTCKDAWMKNAKYSQKIMLVDQYVKYGTRLHQIGLAVI